MRENDPHFWEGTAPLSAVALAPSEMGAAATWGGRMSEVRLEVLPGASVPDPPTCGLATDQRQIAIH